MIKTIDHIIIHSPSAQDTLKEIEDIFGIQAYVPLSDYGHFKSAMLHFGNLDVEILEMGESALSMNKITASNDVVFACRSNNQEPRTRWMILFWCKGSLGS